MTDSQPVPKQQSQNPELADFANFAKLPKKIEPPEKLELPAKRGFKLLEKGKSRRASCPLANPHS